MWELYQRLRDELSLDLQHWVKSGIVKCYMLERIDLIWFKVC